MPDDDAVKVFGFDELVAGTRQLAANIEKRAHRELQRTAQERANLVRATVPRVTGHLAGSVTVADMSGGLVAAGIGDGVPYAGWIEFGGTRGRTYMPEGRYFYPVMRDEQGLERDADRYTTEEIKGMRWPTPTEL